MVSKKGVSLMVSYVILISIAVGLSIGVYVWLKDYANLSAKIDCKEGTSLFLDDFDYDGEIINLSLKNNGYFNISGFIMGASNETGKAPIDLLNATGAGTEGFPLGHYYFDPPLKPGDIMNATFNANNTLVIQIQPFILDEKGDKIVCEGAVIKQNLELEVCAETDTSCGLYSCENCNLQDGCDAGSQYLDYYCIDNANGCGYNDITQAESGANGNCVDGIDNDCDGDEDCADSDCSTNPVCIQIYTIFFEDFEDTGIWSTSTVNSNCAYRGSFSNCDSDGGDYDFYISTNPFSGTYSLTFDDWDTFSYSAGLWEVINPTTACSGQCSDINISFYEHNYGLDSGEFCIIWARYSDSSNADIWRCTNGDACYDAGTDSTPEPDDYDFREISLNSLGIDLSDAALEIHIGSSGTGSADYCFWDNFNITGFG